jgi:prepilin-type N-terminal cleavage/methylation domain-containing protein
MRVRSRRAFSLVELLIVIAILVLLGGISLSGLQAARESARRLCCAGNLRELGLGLQHHHQALGVLPPSRGGPDSTATIVWGMPPKLKPYPAPGVGTASGFAMLLPYIGEMALAAAIAEAGWPLTTHDVYSSATIHTLLCPSDVAPRSHNYLFSIGDRYRYFWPALAHGIPPAENTGFQSNLRGLFGLQSRVRLESVRDGLSQTLALSECVRPRGLGRTISSGDFEDGIRYQGDFQGGPGEAVANNRFAVSFSNYDSPVDCLASFSPERFHPGVVLMSMNSSPGWLWSKGAASVVSFSTVLPPNGPRCNDYTSGGSLTPQSRHPGGVLGLMADGAVRFITNDIDAGDPSLLDGKSGPSPYGVWGALGSRAGAEPTVVSLP